MKQQIAICHRCKEQRLLEFEYTVLTKTGHDKTYTLCPSCVRTMLLTFIAMPKGLENFERAMRGYDI